MHRIWIILLILALAPRRAAAQLPESAPDSRIRVTHNCRVADDGSVRCYSGSSARHWRHTGTFVGVHSDTLFLQNPDYQTEVRLPLTAIQRLEVSHGEQSRWRMGSTIGLVVGALAGGAIGGADGANSRADFDVAPTEAYVAGGIILGATAGFVAGAITGSFFKTDRWIEQPVLAMGFVEPQSSTKACAMSIRLRF